tara:strand:- start:28928 stop:29269 length:342 start_codon:yes stop_codon:yes gene_type:complete
MSENLVTRLIKEHNPLTIIFNEIMNDELSIRFMTSSELKVHNVNYDTLEVKILPFKTVGVQGDHRTYLHPVDIGVYKNGTPIINHDVMGIMCTKIPNEIKSVNRVIWTLAKKD